jgi:hypothetical protein
MVCEEAGKNERCLVEDPIPLRLAFSILATYSLITL